MEPMRNKLDPVNTKSNLRCFSIVSGSPKMPLPFKFPTIFLQNIHFPMQIILQKNFAAKNNVYCSL